MQEDGIAMREAHPSEDLEEIYAVEERVVAASPEVLDTGSAQALREFIERDGDASVYLWWSEPEGGPVAYLALSDRPDEEVVEIRSIAVVPEHQGRGLGARMIATALAFAHERGRSALELATSPANGGALRFYERHGFAQARREEDHMGYGVARLILVRRLDARAG